MAYQTIISQKSLRMKMSFLKNELIKNQINHKAHGTQNQQK